MIPGYDAGTLWLHDPGSAIHSLAALGYRCVAVRSRRGSLNPGESAFETQWAATIAAAESRDCQLVIDTEAHYVLDPHLRDLPSLCGDNDVIVGVLLDWLRHWIRAAASLPNAIVTISSGWSADVAGSDRGPSAGISAVDVDSTETQLERLAERLGPLLEFADESGVKLALRPAAGRLIDSVAAFERLRHWLPGGDCGHALGLAADTREMMLAGEWPLAARLQRNRSSLAMVYLADMNSLPTTAEGTDGSSVSRTRRDAWLGQGDLALSRLLDSFQRMPFAGPVVVRTEGHAESGFEPARQAAGALRLTPDSVG